MRTIGMLGGMSWESTVVLGCTELELLLTAADRAVPLLPTARLHVQAAVTAALAP